LIKRHKQSVNESEATRVKVGKLLALVVVVSAAVTVKFCPSDLWCMQLRDHSVISNSMQQKVLFRS